MAAGRHNLTRRALLGAGVGACAAPLSDAATDDGAGAESAAAGPGPEEAWERALAAFRRAEAALAASARRFAVLPPELRAYPACEPWEDRLDDAECARLAALRRLLAVPAPDLPALALKIERLVADQAWEFDGAETFLPALAADARRLSANSSA